MSTHRRQSEGTYDRMWRLPSWRRRQEEVWKSTLRFHICLSRRMWRLWPEAGKWQEKIFCGVQTRDPNLRVICEVATDRVEEQAWLVVSPRGTDTGAGGQSGSHAPTNLVYFGLFVIFESQYFFCISIILLLQFMSQMWYCSYLYTSCPPHQTVSSLRSGIMSNFSSYPPVCLEKCLHTVGAD